MDIKDSSGQLMQLVVYNENNTYFKNDCVHGIAQLKAESNKELIIGLTCDMIKICSILIPNDININDIDEFSITSDDNIIFKIPFILMYMLSEISVIDDKRCIKINDSIINLRYNECNYSVPIIALCYARVYIKLSTKRNFDYTIIMQKIFFNTDYRIQLINNGINI